MVDAFKAKFAVIVDKVTMADLVNTKPKKDERILEYINRWRNLSIKCERSITEREAVELIMRKIDNWMKPFLGVANIHTYHDLNQCVHRLESNPPVGWPGTSGSKVKKVGKAESKATFTKAANTSTGTSSNAGNSSSGSGDKKNKPVFGG